MNKNLAGIPSGPVALFVSRDLIIPLTSLAVGSGRSNLLSVLKMPYFLNARMVTPLFWTYDLGARIKFCFVNA